MPIKELLGLPEGYQVWSGFLGKYALVEIRVRERPLVIAEFVYLPKLDECLRDIAAWEKLRANVRGQNERKL